MLREPTIEDFADWVQSHLDKCVDSSRKFLGAVGVGLGIG
jgi:hypothetical protein